MAAVSQLSPIEPFYYSGQGEVFLGPVGGYDASAASPEGFRFFGNAPTLELTPNEEATEHKESTTGQRSTDRRVVTGRTIAGTLTVEQWSPDNLSLAFFTDEVADAAGSVTDEDIGNAPINIMIPLAHQGVTNVVITDSASGGPNTLPSSQYVVDKRSGSIMITNKTTGGPYTAPFLVSYDYQARIQLPIFNVPSGTDYMLRFHGLNTQEADADGDLGLILELYKIEFLPGQSVPFINEGLSPLTLSFIAQLDTARAVDATLGRFGQIIMTVPVEEQS